MERIKDSIRKFEENGVSDVELIALVSATSREVIFYCTMDGRRYQSNNLIEEGKLPASVVEGFYDEITELVRKDVRFKRDRLNIIMASAVRLKIDYYRKNCSSYDIIKKWKKDLL